MTEPDLPDDIWEHIPHEQYCACATIWVGIPQVTTPGVQVTFRIKCQACGRWTGAVPEGPK